MNYLDSVLADTKKTQARTKSRTGMLSALVDSMGEVGLATPAPAPGSPQGMQQAAMRALKGTLGSKKAYELFGDPDSPDWAGANLTNIKSPTGQTWQVNKKVAQSFQGLINELNGMGYRTESSGGYNNRNIRGGNSKSLHAFGNAIDINAGRNPMGSKLITDMPKNIAELAGKYGLVWGGSWNGRKDPMHFEWIGNG